MSPEEPTQAVIGVRAFPDADRRLLQEAVREAVRAIEAKVDTHIDQLRADAQSLETCASILARMPRSDVPFANPEKVIDGLSAMASGMRLAADRMPDSREIPF